MSSPFLVGFSRAVLDALQREDLVEVREGRRDHAARYVAGHLASVERGSLISSLARGLIACPDIDELYADDDRLKQIVTDLESTPTAWVRG